MVDTTFIYFLKDPENPIKGYVGKSDNPTFRFGGHIRESRDKKPTYRKNWIKSLASRGLKPVLEIVDEVPKSEWQFWEIEYIKVFRALGFKLVNGTNGGDGGSPMLGRNHSEKTKAAIRAAHSGEKSYWFGKKMHPKALEKLRLAHLGIPLPEEHRKKISASLLRRKHQDNTSGFVGVSWDKETKKWDVRFRKNKKRIYLGQFLKLEDAVFIHALAREII